MKRIIALLLCAVMLLSGCSSATPVTSSSGDTTSETESVNSDDTLTDSGLQFDRLDDDELLSYVEDLVYSETIDALNSEDYVVENVSAVYISKEYIEELSYNSQSNIYFGYTLDELDALFEGTRYIFTLGDDGQTGVQELQEIADTDTDTILKNVAIGTGVILVCVTVSVVSGGIGAPAVSMIFAASAKTATLFALSSGGIGAVSAAIVRGYQTGDMNEALQAAALSGSEGYKWGAFTGAISGGVTETLGLYGATFKGLTMNEAAVIQKESKWPLSIIKNISSMAEYEHYKEIGLTVELINGNPALIQAIDLNYESELAGKTVTNLERMRQGYAPINPATQTAYELHHVGQAVDSPLAILTEPQHRSGYSNGILHDPNIESGTGVHAVLTNAEWATQRQTFWKSFYKFVIS